jgi:hypothetical protein
LKKKPILIGAIDYGFYRKKTLIKVGAHRPGRQAFLKIPKYFYYRFCIGAAFAWGSPPLFILTVIPDFHSHPFINIQR